MGMDVYGVTGTYFRRNVWGWRPLADYCIAMAPQIAASCASWHTNEGEGLDEGDALAFADILDETLRDGRAARHVADRDAELAALPQVQCRQCDGTVVRSDDIGRSWGMTTLVMDKPGHPRLGQTGWCNGCDGVGTAPAWDTFYQLTVEDIAAFAAFLRDSGGFEIH